MCGHLLLWLCWFYSVFDLRCFMYWFGCLHHCGLLYALLFAVMLVVLITLDILLKVSYYVVVVLAWVFCVDLDC